MRTHSSCNVLLEDSHYLWVDWDTPDKRGYVPVREVAVLSKDQSIIGPEDYADPGYLDSLTPAKDSDALDIAHRVASYHSTLPDVQHIVAS